MNQVAEALLVLLVEPALLIDEFGAIEEQRLGTPLDTSVVEVDNLETFGAAVFFESIPDEFK